MAELIRALLGTIPLVILHRMKCVAQRWECHHATADQATAGGSTENLVDVSLCCLILFKHNLYPNTDKNKKPGVSISLLLLKNT